MSTLALSAATPSRPTVWTGRTASALAIVFLVMDTAIKFSGHPSVAESFNQLGIPVALAATIGTIELVCLALYVWPRTSFIGALLLTGYLGGATVVHVRVGNPLASHILFPSYVGALVWGGLVLRDARVRDLLFARR